MMSKKCFRDLCLSRHHKIIVLTSPRSTQSTLLFHIPANAVTFSEAT